MAAWNFTTSCPSSKPEIVNRGLSLGCQEGREYHCLMDQNGVTGEICVSRTWVEPEYCPEYNRIAQKLDVYSCNEEHGACPPVLYWSNTSFQYSGCMYIETSQHKTTEVSILYSTDSVDHPRSMPMQVLLPVIIVALFVVAIILIIFIRRRRNRRFKKHDEESEMKPLLELRGYDMLHKGELALEEHEQDRTYVPTQGFVWTTEVLKNYNVVVISGIIGSGKTKTALHTASKWKWKQDESSHFVLIESINEIPNVVDRKLENVIIMLDDCFTRWTLECTAGSLTSMCAELYCQVCHSNNVKLIITIDYNIYQRHKTWLSHIDLFKEHLVVTLPIEMADKADFTRDKQNMEELLQEERKAIIQSHIKHHNAKVCNSTTEIESERNIDIKDKDIQKIIARQYVDIGFPSLCAMFVRLHETSSLTAEFFEIYDAKIAKVLEMKYETERAKRKQKKCVLSYAVLKDRCIDVDELDLGLLNKLAALYKIHPPNKEMVSSIVAEMEKTFLVYMRNGSYKIADTAVYNKCIQYWSHERTEHFLTFSSVKLIQELIRPKEYKPKAVEPIFVVKESTHIKCLVKRFKDLLKEHPELKHHPIMSMKDFQKKREKYEQKTKSTVNTDENNIIEEKLEFSNAANETAKIDQIANSSDSSKSIDKADQTEKSTDTSNEMENFKQKASNKINEDEQKGKYIDISNKAGKVKQKGKCTDTSNKTKDDERKGKYINTSNELENVEENGDFSDTSKFTDNDEQTGKFTDTSNKMEKVKQKSKCSDTSGEKEKVEEKGKCTDTSYKEGKVTQKGKCTDTSTNTEEDEQKGKCIDTSNKVEKVEEKGDFSDTSKSTDNVEQTGKSTDTSNKLEKVKQKGKCAVM